MNQWTLDFSLKRKSVAHFQIALLNYVTLAKDRSSAPALTYFAQQTVLSVFIALGALSLLRYLKFLSSA